MKKFFWVIWAVVLSHYSIALASPITVRSGDHDGFTRLVLQLPSNVRWEASGVPGRQSITFLGHDDGFNISRVFDVIPRDQLVDIVQYPSRLELVLSCECETDFFVERGEYLVVDVQDGPPLAPTNEPTNPAFVSIEPHSNFMFGELLWADSDGRRENPQPQQTAGSTNLTDNNTRPDNSGAISLEEQMADSIRETLLQGVANAASRGLVQPSVTESLSRNVTNTQRNSVEIYDSSSEKVPEVKQDIKNTSALNNLRITNSRDSPLAENGFTLMNSGAVCADAGPVNVSNWGDAQPFHLQISSLRALLFSEIDHLNEENAVSLARRYIYFGFGAEAKQVLRLSENLTNSHPELMDLADIVDFGFARNPRFVHQFSDCNSDLALWALMAARTIPENKSFNSDAALRALAKLPSHLRNVIAPALSKRFSEIGRAEEAAIALRRVDLETVTTAPDAKVAKAIIEKGNGAVEKSNTLLSEVYQSNSDESPEALVTYVENRLKDFLAVPAEISLLIESFEFELKNSQLGPQLFSAHVIASGLSGQFSKAFDLLGRVDEENIPVNESELRSHLFSALAKNANEMVFLENYFSHFSDSTSNIHDETKFFTASRLKELGFNEISQNILMSIPAEQRTLEVRLLIAETSLVANQPELALENLVNASGNKADELRARAHLALGNNSMAMELFNTAGMSETATRAAWLSEDWVNLTSQDSEIFGDIRRLADVSVQQITTANGMIAETAQALDASASARNTVTNLLENVSVSP